MGKEAKPVKRFWDKVAVGDDCWLWHGYKNPQGYGRCLGFGKSLEYAHRLSWRIKYGSIPSGKVVCHTCDRPDCVRPGHLFLGTQKENVADCMTKGRRNTPVGFKQSPEWIAKRVMNRYANRTYGKRLNP